MPRKPISKKIRFEVFKRDSFTCQYCGASAPETVLRVDHIHPVSKDGDNDILNLITSCQPCNAGKSDRLLSDNSAILKQKGQLDELQERREQLEMMLEWREGLKEIGALEVEAIGREWVEVAAGFHLNETGTQSAKRLVTKFGLQNVLDAIQKSSVYLRLDTDGQFTQESVELAWSKIGGICRLSQQPDWKRELYYLRGILRKRVYYCSDWQAIKWLEQAYKQGADLEDLRFIVLSVPNWTSFKEEIFQFISEEDADA